jgi:hypothetical protein
LWYSIAAMRWIKKSWWLGGILAIALIVGWKEERCQSQAYQCRATYAAQAQSERASRPVSVYQHASEDQAVTSACEPNGYFCRLFGAANLPTVLLVFIGISGIWAALRTLRAIEQQNGELQESISVARTSATAAQASADALIAIERAWIDVNAFVLPEPGWMPGTPLGRIFMRAQNKGRTPAQFVSGTIQLAFVDTPDDLPNPPVYNRPFISPNTTLITSEAFFDPSPFPNPRAVIQQRAIQEQMFNPNQILIFYGNIVYDDVVGTQRHETRWCYAWSENAGFTRTGPNGKRYEQYNRYG